MRNIRWDMHCLPNDMIEQTRAENAAACLFRSSASSPLNQTSVCSLVWEQLGKILTYEGWGIALINEVGICLNAWPFPPSGWIKHWLGIDSGEFSKRQPVPHLLPQIIHAFFQKNTNQSDCVPTKWCYQRIRTMQQLKGTGRNCCLWSFSMKNRMIALEDQTFLLPFLYRWKAHSCFITNTHIWLCTLPSQSMCISNIPSDCCNFFPMIFFFFTLCMLGKWKQRWNLVIELFFIHAVFLCKYRAVKCKLDSAAGCHRELAWRCGIPLGYYTIPHSFLSHFSCHSNQNQRLWTVLNRNRISSIWYCDTVFLQPSTCWLKPASLECGWCFKTITNSFVCFLVPEFFVPQTGSNIDLG